MTQIQFFLDISIQLTDNNIVETDYKYTNSHDYLNYLIHLKSNIPFTLVKRTNVLISNGVKVDSRRLELKNYLLNCGYPEEVIENNFYKPRLEGPAPKPTSKVKYYSFCNNKLWKY